MAKFSQVVIVVISLLIGIWLITRFSKHQLPVKVTADLSFLSAPPIDQIRVRNLDGRMIHVNKYEGGRESVHSS
jgi:hypothetical protein